MSFLHFFFNDSVYYYLLVWDVAEPTGQSLKLGWGYGSVCGGVPFLLLSKVRLHKREGGSKKKQKIRIVNFGGFGLFVSGREGSV